MRNRSRDWRRAQRERAIARAERWMRSYGMFDPRFYRWEDSERNKRVRQNATTPHPCSGHCCGNPRRHTGEETRQEVVSRLRERDLF